MNLKKNFAELDKWTKMLSPIQYQPADLVQPAPGLTILPVYGIQQIKKELEEFAQVIVSQPWFASGATGLEIGLGHYGSSHLFWRGLFSKIVTIEQSHERVNRFAENTLKFYKKWVLDEKSEFVIGSSQDPVSVAKVYDNYDSIDFLFIDGGHSYKAVLADWLLYAPLVAPGGMVAFHDSKEINEENGGVPRLLNELQSGKFNQTYNLHHICYSDQVGVSYYIKE